MTYEQYIQLMNAPQEASLQHVLELDFMVNELPYFGTARLLRLKALFQTQDIRFGVELPRTTVYASSAPALYQYINPPETQPEVRNTTHGSSYFDMMDRLQEMSDHSQQSLQELTQKLLDHHAAASETPMPTPQADKSADDTPQIRPEEEKQRETPVLTVQAAAPAETERSAEDITPTRSEEPFAASSDDLQHLIANRRYDLAIETIKRNHLNNPKKSIYFADQIRFLETARRYAVTETGSLSEETK